MEHGTTPSAPRPEHFRAIYDALPDPAGITRVADGMYLEVNPAFCQLLGLSREQILGRTSTELSIWAANQERSKLVTTLQRDGNERYSTDIIGNEMQMLGGRPQGERSERADTGGDRGADRGGYSRSAATRQSGGMPPRDNGPSAPMPDSRMADFPEDDIPF